MYAKAWTDTSKQGKEIDVILCPPSFGAACPHERSRYWGYTCQYRRGPTDAFYQRSG
jgi:amidase